MPSYLADLYFMDVKIKTEPIDNIKKELKFPTIILNDQDMKYEDGKIFDTIKCAELVFKFDGMSKVDKEKDEVTFNYIYKGIEV